MKNKICSILLIINTSLFIISLSISFVLLFRPFYYYHINYLNIVETSGYNYSEIKEAYDDVIDYLVLDKLFSTGSLKYSLDGYDHFKDCQLLFRINFIILFVSLIIIILKRKFFNNIFTFKHNISFWSGCLNISIFIILYIISIIIGFDKCFEIFHNIFFLGKGNWLLNSKTDEIIKILPQEFFMNCAILVLSIIGIISIILILKEILIKRKK